MKVYSTAHKSLTILTAALAMTAILIGCKGRTAENMVPTGDTVEVVIEQPVAENDSISNSIITDSLK